MNVKFTPKLVAGIAVALVALIAVVGWFGLVSPQRSKATKLNTQITDAKDKLGIAKLLANSQKNGKGKASGAALLVTAMPAQIQMPLVLRQVQRLAETSNVRLDSFAPSTATPLAGYNSVPISVSVAGRYAAVQHFLRRLRAQAGSNGGRIHASGRLYDVSNVGLSPGSGENASDLKASITLSTFVYTGIPLPAATTTTTTSTDGTA